jgi:AraC-like DNA-binding protein
MKGAMEPLLSTSGEPLLALKKLQAGDLGQPLQYATYLVLFIPAGAGVYHADFGSFPFKGPVLLFATPFQTIHLDGPQAADLRLLQFHGDFYCIEYHRVEVACNGLLFNNVYITPMVTLTEEEAKGIEQVLAQLGEELGQANRSGAVLQAYLQLLLAKCSSIKRRAMSAGEELPVKDEQMERFRDLLEQHYLTLRKPNDYARLLAMPPNTFTKRCTRYFSKPPSQLIQERLILEAKKQLHLTRNSIKEIAYALNFEDEFYFSRVFKKFTHVSPQTFRDKTGISIMADLSM